MVRRHCGLAAHSTPPSLLARMLGEYKAICRPRCTGIVERATSETPMPKHCLEVEEQRIPCDDGRVSLGSMPSPRSFETTSWLKWERLWLIAVVVSGLQLELQMAIGNGLSFDSFSFIKNGWHVSEIDVGRGDKPRLAHPGQPHSGILLDGRCTPGLLLSDRQSNDRICPRLCENSSGRRGDVILSLI